MAGRKTRYSEKIVLRLIDALGSGMPISLACKYAPIAQSTFFDWKNKRPEFSERIDQAIGDHALTNLLLIQQAANDGDWRAAQAKLRLRHPKTFGEHVTQDTHVTVDHTIAAQELMELLEKEVPDGDARYRISLALLEGGNSTAGNTEGAAGD